MNNNKKANRKSTHETRKLFHILTDHHYRERHHQRVPPQPHNGKSPTRDMRLTLDESLLLKRKPARIITPLPISASTGGPTSPRAHTDRANSTGNRLWERSDSKQNTERRKSKIGDRRIRPINSDSSLAEILPLSLPPLAPLSKSTNDLPDLSDLTDINPDDKNISNNIGNIIGNNISTNFSNNISNNIGNNFNNNISNNYSNRKAPVKILPDLDGNNQYSFFNHKIPGIDSESGHANINSNNSRKRPDRIQPEHFDENNHSNISYKIPLVILKEESADGQNNISSNISRKSPIKIQSEKVEVKNHSNNNRKRPPPESDSNHNISNNISNNISSNINRKIPVKIPPPEGFMQNHNNNNRKISREYIENLKQKAGPTKTVNNFSRLIGDSVSEKKGKISYSPIAGYHLKGLVPLQEAVTPLINLIPQLDVHIQHAYKFVNENFSEEILRKKKELLAAVNLYTQEWDPAGDSLYYRMNQLLRDNGLSHNEKFEKLKPFHQYLNLLLTELKSIPRFKGTIYRGIKIDLSKVFTPNSIHEWWSITSCTDVVGGIAEFLDTEGPRTFLDIMSYRGVKISQYSIYPNESEILLLPGTVLKVIDQLYMGNGLVVVQMKEIPSNTEIDDTLLHDQDAIHFWTTLSVDRFEIPLEDFCQALMRKMGLPVVRKLVKDSYLDLEAYQKYWSLWIFSGGDLNLLSAYTKNTPNYYVPPSEYMISLHRFGLLLTWFGHFSTLLDELYNAIHRGIIYDDSTTSPVAVTLLNQSSNNLMHDQWLIRCSPLRDTPYTLSYAKPKEMGYEITHQRILFNCATRQYIFHNLETKEAISNESINNLIDRIKKEYKLGKGKGNSKISIITNPENFNFHLYEGESYIINNTPIL